MSKATTTVRVISNGDYAVLVTASGGGYSALRGLALTRWQPDPSADDDGQRIYIRDVGSGEYWSLSDGTCSVTVYDDHLEETCEHDGILVTSIIRVDRDRSAETRTIRVTNQSGRERTIDVTTYAELSLNSAAADAAHPAFAKLFVQTAFDAGRNVLIAWRRLRSPDDRALWVGQRLTGAVEYETDRTRFIGRTRTASNPAALNSRAPLSGNTGTVLDPVFGLRAPLQIAADESAEIVLLQCAADTVPSSSACWMHRARLCTRPAAIRGRSAFRRNGSLASHSICTSTPGKAAAPSIARTKHPRALTTADSATMAASTSWTWRRTCSLRRSRGST
jgi:hypothetical protein